MIRILSIDGGGVRGVLPAMVLAEIEERTQKPICELFDLIVGTSAGGVLALYLTKPTYDGKPSYHASDIVRIISNASGDIFSRSFMRRITTVWGLFGSKYSSDNIELDLQNEFGKLPLSSTLTNVMINAYDLHSRSPCFFKSWDSQFNSLLVKDIAMATSAAPTYFPPKKIIHKDRRLSLVDGGVCVNNPAMSAYTEAIRIFKSMPDVLVVSLGTGEQHKSIPYRSAKRWGKVNWLTSLLSIIFDGSSDVVDYQLKRILRNNYFRITTTLTHANDALDDASPQNIANLKKDAQEMIFNNEQQLNHICALLKNDDGLVDRRVNEKIHAM